MPRKLVRLHPGCPDALACQGLVLVSTGQIAAAEKALEAALKIRPDHIHALNLLGKCAIAKGAWSDAREHLEHALQLHPNFADAHANLCLFHYTTALAVDNPTEELREALTHAQAAAALVPDNPEYVLNLGLAYAKLEEYALAITQFQEVIQMTPEDGEAHLCLAYALLATEEYAAARVAGKQAAKHGRPDGHDIARRAEAQMKDRRMMADRECTAGYARTSQVDRKQEAYCIPWAQHDVETRSTGRTAFARVCGFD